jgi:hypothetical protein
MSQYVGGSSSPIFLPLDFNLSPKANVPKSSTKKFNILPLSTGYFQQGDVIKFEIPAGISKNQLIDPTQTYLMFTCVNKDANNVPFFLDHNAACFINKLETFSSSQTLETITNYNNLYATILDIQKSGYDRATDLSITQGTDVDPLNATNTSRGGQVVTAAYNPRYAIPLISGVLGTLNDKMLPIGMMNDLRLELTLESAANAVISATTSSTSSSIWQLINVELAITVITLDNDVVDAIIPRSGEILLSTEMYRNYNTTLQASNTSDQNIIALKFASVKSLLATYRLANNFNNFNVGTISSRRNPFASPVNNPSGNSTTPACQFLIGNNYVPSLPMRSVQEFYVELQKAIHSYPSVHNKCALNRYTYDQSAEPASTLAPIIQAVSVTTALGVITVTSTTNFEVGMPVVFYQNSATAASATGIVLGQIYLIESVPSSTTFTICLPSGTTLNNVTTTSQTLTAVGAVASTSVAVFPVLYWGNTPSFVFGVNCDVLYQSSDKAFGGMNTQSANIFLNANAYSAATPTGGQRLDVYAHYDSILHIDCETKQVRVSY